MSAKREFRFITSELVAGEEVRDGKPAARTLSGYASVFDQVAEIPTFFGDSFREVVKPGAFKRTLAEGADVRALLNHDPNVVLGRSKAGTLALSEDQKGLRFTVQLPNTNAARDLHESISRGDIDQCSFGFTVREQKWLTEKVDGGAVQRTRELLDLDLFDVSAVTYPAYVGTTVSARSLWPDGAPEDLPAELREKSTYELAAERAAEIAAEAIGHRQPAGLAESDAIRLHMRQALAEREQ